MTGFRADLRAIGAALYGERWQAPLARSLGVPRRTLQRWAAGKPPLHEPDIRRRIAELVAARLEILRAVSLSPSAPRPPD